MQKGCVRPTIPWGERWDALEQMRIRESPSAHDQVDGRGCTFFSGIGDGMRFTRHGLSGVPFQLRPMTVPNRHSGTLMQVQMRTTTTMLPNGTAASE